MVGVSYSYCLTSADGRSNRYIIAVIDSYGANFVIQLIIISKFENNKC